MLLSHEGLFSTSVHDTYIIDCVNQSMPHLIPYTVYQLQIQPPQWARL